MSQVPAKVAVFLHAGDYDRVHQGLSIAATACAAGRPVDVFFFWFALQRLLADALDAPEGEDLGGDETLAHRFEQRQLPTLRALLEHVREGGGHVYACSGSLAAVAAEPGNLPRQVDQVVGWSTILQLTAGVTDRFYL